jgi:hypothetical protein
MRKLCIVIGLSIFFFTGIVAQASAQKTPCWDLIPDGYCDTQTEDKNHDGKGNGRDCQGDSGTQAGEIRGSINNLCDPNDSSGILLYIPGESFMVKTGPIGEFVLHYVPAGTYDLIIEYGPDLITVGDVQVEENGITDLGTIPICPELSYLPFSKAYYTYSDNDGQAELATEEGILIDRVVATGYVNLGPDYPADSIGGDLSSAQSVSKVRMYGDNEEWSNFKVLYNTANNAYGWTEVTNLNVTKYKEEGGLGGKKTNELSFDTVSARWWKVWADYTGTTGVISVYEFEAYGE